jgi:alanyl-tRNA synthetase
MDAQDFNPNKKNYDPKMHSAEHLLNGTMVKMFNRGRSFSNHIEKKKSKCDYHFDRDLTDVEIKRIEESVNEQITRNLKVTEEFLSREDAEKEFNMEKLPEDAGDVIRVINIGDYDRCLCSGEHINSTAEIGGFRIVSTSFDDGVLRVRFKLKN